MEYNLMLVLFSNFYSRILYSSNDTTPLSSYVKAFMPAFLASVAITCGLAGTTYCETFQFAQTNGDATLYGGVWSYKTKGWVEIGGDIWVYTTCKSYGALEDDSGLDFDFDSKANTAKAFSIIAPVIGGIALFWAWLAPCSGRHASTWKAFGAIFAFTSILQGLTLIMISSSICLDNPVLQYFEVARPVLSDTFESECEIGPGYRLVITSVVFWALAGLFPCVVAPPVITNQAPPQTQTVTYQRNADGTVEEQNVSEQPVDPESKD